MQQADLDALTALMAKLQSYGCKFGLKREPDEAALLLAAAPAMIAIGERQRKQIRDMAMTIAQTGSVAREHYDEWIERGCDGKDAIRMASDIANVCDAAIVKGWEYATS